MGKAYRKGYRGEREVVEFFEDLGFHAWRRPLSGGGTHGGDADVVVDIGNEKFDIEVKRRKDGYKTLYKLLSKADIAMVRADRHDWLVIMTEDTFRTIVQILDKGGAKAL